MNTPPRQRPDPSSAPTSRSAWRATPGRLIWTRNSRKSKLAKFLKLFKSWGSGTLAASTAIPIPTPTSMFFAAAGASDYPLGKFLVIVTLGRAVRYSAIAFVADHYGRHFLRVLRHPMQYWGWMLLFVTLMIALIAGGILLSRRLETASV